MICNDERLKADCLKQQANEIMLKGSKSNIIIVVIWVKVVKTQIHIITIGGHPMGV